MSVELPFTRFELEGLLQDVKAARNEAMNRSKAAKTAHERVALDHRRRRLGRLRQYLFACHAEVLEAEDG